MRPPETRFEELKRYVSFTDDDARALAELGPIAAPQFPRIAREFYDRIREHEDAHAVITGEDQITRLQLSLVRWMTRLFSGVYDEAYFAETTKIGRVHVKVGLPQHYMFTAMALIRVSLTRIAEEKMGARSTVCREAITRLLDLELAIMLEAYREDFVARVRRVELLERQELNRTLARTEHRYVNAVELAHVMIIGLDARGGIRLFNREAERVTGFARDEVMGKDFVETLMQEDLVESHGALVREAFSGKSGVPSGARPPLNSAVRTRAGRYRDVRWQLAYAPSEPSQGEDEVVLFVIGMDTTDANALAERTRQAEKLAAVGTLAAGLAHEIRNPLNGAQLHVEFLARSLKRASASDDAIEAVEVVADEIKRLANLVSEFLDFARPQPPIRKPINVIALCDRALQMSASRAREANVTLERDMPTRDIEMLADAAKLEQVLLNLLNNAIEAMAPEQRHGDGGGTITLRARRHPRHVLLEVEDQGPGLPSADAPIFDPFFSTKPDGTGLGLAITHRIVSDHHGSITVESRPGRTVFRVSLPLEAQ